MFRTMQDAWCKPYEDMAMDYIGYMNKQVAAADQSHGDGVPPTENENDEEAFASPTSAEKQPLSSPVAPPEDGNDTDNDKTVFQNMHNEETDDDGTLDVTSSPVIAFDMPFIDGSSSGTVHTQDADGEHVEDAPLTHVADVEPVGHAPLPSVADTAAEPVEDVALPSVAAAPATTGGIFVSASTLFDAVGRKDGVDKEGGVMKSPSSTEHGEVNVVPSSSTQDLGKNT